MPSYLCSCNVPAQRQDSILQSSTQHLSILSTTAGGAAAAACDISQHGTQHSKKGWEVGGGGGGVGARGKGGWGLRAGAREKEMQGEGTVGSHVRSTTLNAATTQKNI